MNRKLAGFSATLGLAAGTILAQSSLHVSPDNWPALLVLSLVIAACCALYYQQEDIPDSSVSFSGAAIIAAIIVEGPHVALWATAIGNLIYHFVRTGRLVSLIFNLSQEVILGWVAFQAFFLLGGQWGPAFDHPIQALAMAATNIVAGTMLFAVSLRVRDGRSLIGGLRALLDPASLRAYMMTMVVGILAGFAYLKGGALWAAAVVGFAVMLSNTLSRYFDAIRDARNQADQLGAVLNATQGALIHTDPTGVIRVANRQAGVLFQVDPTDLIGQAESDVPELREIRLHMQSQEEQIQQVIELTRGPARFVHRYRAALHSPKGEARGHIEVFTDVTPLKEAEENLRVLHHSMIRALTAAIDARDAYTHGHSARVSAYALAIARELGLPSADAERIEYAGLLHDIGKLGIDDRVLRKHGALSPSERALMMRHPVIGAEVLAKANVLTDLIPGVRWHHEWTSGGGYPDGLRGDAIPLDARIIGVADALDAMTTDRPYRAALSVDEAVQRLRAGAGVQFDAAVVAAVTAALTEGRLMTGDLPVPPPAAPPADASGTIRPVHGKELSVLYQLSREDYAALNLESMLSRYLETFHEIVGAHTYLIYLLDPETGEPVLCSEAGLKEQEGCTKDLRLVHEVLQTGTPLVVPDLRAIESYRPAHRAARSEAVIPLVAQNETLGALVVEATLPSAFATDDLYLLQAIAQQLCSSIKLVRYHERLSFAAQHDGLTGVHNHSFFYDRLTEEVARSARYSRPVSIILLDINGLKAVNDSHGHLAGDAVLREYGPTLKQAVRSIDVVARYGGDEFAIILPETGRPEAEQALRRLCAALNRSFDYNGMCLPLPTASWGIASFPEDGKRATELVQKADAAMYREKTKHHGQKRRGC